MKLPLSLSRFRHKPQTGFTLVALIMVMVLMGILATVTLPRFNFSGFNQVGFRDKLKATIEFARKSAVAQRRITCIALAGNSLALTIDNVPTDAPSAGTCPRQRTLPTNDAVCGGPIMLFVPPMG